MGFENIIPGAEAQMMSAPLVEPLADTDTPLDVLAAAFRRQNIASNFDVRRVIPFTGVPLFENYVQDPDYDPFDGLEPEYQDYWDKFTGMRSKAEVNAMKGKIRGEWRDRETLKRAGWPGIAAEIAAGVVDPINMGLMFTPLGVPGQLATKAQAAKALAIGGGAAVAASEAGLQAVQETRTIEESAYGVAGSVLLGGVLGRFIGMPAKEFDAALEEATGVFKSLARGGIDDLPDSASAAKAVGSLTEEGATGPLGWGVNPIIRLLKSSSATARSAASRLFNHNFYLGKNKITRADGTVEYKATEDSVQILIKREQDGAISKYKRSLAENWAAYKKSVPRSERKTYEEFKQEVGAAMTRGDESDIPQAAATAADVRKIFDDHRERLVRAGMIDEKFGETPAVVKTKKVADLDEDGVVRALDDEFTGTPAKDPAAPLGAKSYFPRAYNDQIHSLEFENLLRSHFEGKGMEPVEAADAANQVLDNIRGAPDGQIPRFVVPKAGATKERVLDISDESLAPYLDRDIDVVLQKYLRTVMPELVMTEKFGDATLEGLKSSIKGEYKALMEGKSPTIKKKLQAELDGVIRDVNHGRDMFLGNMPRPAESVKIAVKAARIARSWSFMTMLGGMTVSAIPDIGRAIMQHGFTPWVKALGPTFSRWSSGVKLQKQAWRDIGIATEAATASRAMAQADLTDVSGRIGGWTQWFAKLTGMNAWNDAMKSIAAFTAQNRFIGDINRYSVLTKTRKERLAKAGFSEDMIGRMKKELDIHGEDLKGSQVANTDAWTDRDAAVRFENALLRDVEVTIVTPGAGDLPIFMTGEVGKTMLQFRSFLVAAHNQVLLPAMQQMTRGDLAVFEGMSVMIGLGMLAETAKQHLAGRGDELADYKPQDWLRAGIDRSGIATLPMEVFNWADRTSGDFMDDGLSGMMGMREGAKYYDRSMTETLLGPSSGNVERAASLAYRGGQVAAGQYDFTQGDVYNARKLLPYQNLFYTRNLLNMLEQEVAEDLPGKRRRKR